MHYAALTRRLYAVFWLGLAIGVGLLLVTTNTALAHPCDDNYTLEINRANCWWRYTNDQSIPEDMSVMSDDMMMKSGDMMGDTMKSDDMMGDMMKSDDMMGDMMKSDDMMGDMMKSDDMMDSMVDGTVCNSHYTAQQDREDCWWRFHNGLPLIEAQPTMSDDMMMDDTMASDGMVCNTHNTMQVNRENCWWRFHNGLPLITELPITSDGMMMKSDDM